MKKHEVSTYVSEQARVAEGIIAVYSDISNATWAMLPELCLYLNQDLGFVL